jgi:hypothetical protein
MILRSLLAALLLSAVTFLAEDCFDDVAIELASTLTALETNAAKPQNPQENAALGGAKSADDADRSRMLAREGTRSGDVTKLEEAARISPRHCAIPMARSAVLAAQGNADGALAAEAAAFSCYVLVSGQTPSTVYREELLKQYAFQTAEEGTQGRTANQANVQAAFCRMLSAGPAVSARTADGVIFKSVAANCR